MYDYKVEDLTNAAWHAEKYFGDIITCSYIVFTDRIRYLSGLRELYRPNITR